MLGDELERLREAIKCGCRFAVVLSLAQMLHDGLEGVELDEAAERRDGPDGPTGEDERRGCLVDLMPTKPDRLGAERADRAFFSVAVDLGKPLQPPVDLQLKRCGKTFL